MKIESKIKNERYKKVCQKDIATFQDKVNWMHGTFLMRIKKLQFRKSIQTKNSLKLKLLFSQYYFHFLNYSVKILLQCVVTGNQKSKKIRTVCTYTVKIQ